MEAAIFDIDEVIEAELQPPVFPDPPFLPNDVEQLLRMQDMLPNGAEYRELDHGTFALRIPGQTQAAVELE